MAAAERTSEAVVVLARPTAVVSLVDAVLRRMETDESTASLVAAAGPPVRAERGRASRGSHRVARPGSPYHSTAVPPNTLSRSWTESRPVSSSAASTTSQ